jgi:hypothetical protein
MITVVLQNAFLLLDNKSNKCGQIPLPSKDKYSTVMFYRKNAI